MNESRFTSAPVILSTGFTATDQVNEEDQITDDNLVGYVDNALKKAISMTGNQVCLSDWKGDIHTNLIPFYEVD